MQFRALVAALLPLWAGAAKLHLRQSLREPSQACGKGFDHLVEGSQKYFATAKSKLWTHPSHQMSGTTFEPEEKCWFAYMATMKCGSLPSQAATRKKTLSAMCQDVTVTAVEMWKHMTNDEFKWFKENYPAKQIELPGVAAGAEAVTQQEAAQQQQQQEESGEAGEEPTIHDRQVMKTALDLNTKEMLCLTMFTIDDECVKWPYIRMQ